MDSEFRKKGDTWPKVLEYNFKEYGKNRRAMRHKYYGIWKPYTWEDYYRSVKGLALGLLSLGLNPEDKVIIIGDNAPELYFSMLAVQSVHGVSVILYSELTPSEIQYVAEDSGALYAIVEDQEQVDKFLEIEDRLPNLGKIIFWNYKGLTHYENPDLTDYRQVIRQGEDFEKDNPGIFDRNIETGKANDVCAIIYTAGTTGRRPKGVVHTYGNLMASAFYSLKLDRWELNDSIVPYLPPAWISEQIFSVGCHLLSGCTLNLAESPETLQRDVSETCPSIVIYGARIWENLAANVQERILGADAFKKFSFNRLMPQGYNFADSGIDNKERNIFSKIKYTLASAALFRPIKKSLGLSNARICYSTGPILSQEAFKFFHALNLPLKNLYLSTEGGMITGAKNKDIRPDTVGPPSEGVEIKITERGEVIYRHPGLFIEYHQNEGLTSDAIKDGWFYSGDKGLIQENGHVKIIDRVQDLVKLATGEELPPQFIESRLRASPYIKDAWIVTGPNNVYASAIIIINYNSVSLWAGQQRLAFSTFTELSQRTEIYDLIRAEIQRINADLEPALRIRKFANLHKEFDPDAGELTRTMNLRRPFLGERYEKLVRAIYNGKREIDMEVSDLSGSEALEKAQTNIHIQSI